MATLRIKNGRLLDPASGLDATGDIFVEKGRITHVGKTPDKADQELDATGLWVMPGLIDLHVHFRDPGYEYREDVHSGAQSALAGGFTSVVMMPNTNPAIDSASVVEYLNEKASTAPIHVIPSGALTKGLAGKELADMGEMARLGVAAFTDDGYSVMDASVMRAAMEYARDLDRPVMSHCEDTRLSANGHMHEGRWSAQLGIQGIPHAAEDVMVAREIELSALTGCPVHIAHVSTAGAVEMIRRAKERGLPVTGEAAPHHFTSTDALCEGYNTNAKMYPPLRLDEDIEGIIAGLADGTLDAIATDHAPHHEREKVVEFDKAHRGIIGLETALPLTLRLVSEGRLPLMRAIALLTCGPAAVLGWPERGRLAPGAEADITLVDPDIEWTYTRDQVRSKSFNTPYLSWKFKGRARQVVVAGKPHRL